jgi:large-conductance mechanosensitive channel
MKEKGYLFAAIVVIVNVLIISTIIFFSIKVITTIREDGLKSIVEKVWEGEDDSKIE